MNTWSGKIWKFATNTQDQALDHLLPAIVRILALRGYHDSSSMTRFLHQEYPEGLHNPHLLSDMDVVVTLIRTAIERQSKIVIFGDYDVDGITSSLVLHQGLTALGAEHVRIVLPTREEGYGLNAGQVDRLIALNPDLLITVDCGIAAVSEIQTIQQHGIAVIVTDHHEPQDRLPSCPIINPKKPGDPYPNKGLVGCGVVFKLLQALRIDRVLSERSILDLVGLATIADMGPLVGENRVLAKAGIAALRTTTRIGLQALYRVANIDPSQITSSTVGFQIQPRLNVAGRLQTPAIALNLLLADSFESAMSDAMNLNALNIQRQQQTQETLELADRLVDPFDNFISLAIPDIPHGLVGLIAGRLMERYDRPVMVCNNKHGKMTCSLRSPGLSIPDALDTVRDLLMTGGGHQHAGGCSFDPVHFETIQKRLNQYADSHESSNEPPALLIDADIPISDITEELINQLSLLEPFGDSNPAPLFCSAGRVDSIQILKDAHLKFVLVDDTTHTAVPCLMWNMAGYRDRLVKNAMVGIAYQPAKNVYNGKTTIQCIVKDVFS